MARDFLLSALIEDLLDRLERQDHRRFLKSHVTADAISLDDSQEYVHVARDSCGSYLSYHNRYSNFSAEALARPDQIGRADPLLTPRLSPHQ